MLITGAAGFIGSHLADRYLAEGAEVYGVDNLLTGRWENYPTEDASHMTLDISHRHDLYGVANMFKPDLVVHCAASYSDPDKYHRDAETNVLGSINAALTAHFHQAKLIYFNTALPPISSYAISKIAGDQYLHLAVPTAITFRLANVYGPRNVSGPIPTFYRRLHEQQPCTIVRTKRELVYIRDLVQAVITITENPLATGMIDICSGKRVTISEIYEHVQAATGITQQAAEVDPPDDDVPFMDISESRARMFGWHATTSIQEGIEEAVAWYDEHGVGETYTHLRLGTK